MGFDFEGKKTLLYADLFKPRNQNLTQKCDEWSTSVDSSSSGFTTPELESEDGDFIAELSRQMAECMLQEEEKEINDSVPDSALSHPARDVDRNRNSCLELKNHPRVSKQVPVSRVKGGELTQQMLQFQKTEQNYGRYRERNWRKGQVGSGMRAVFLGGSGSRNGPSGTGVFLPRVANDSVELKKKSGLSTVLIPTRVLDAIELHFNRLSDSAGGSPHHASPRDEWSNSNRRPNFEIWAANKDEETHILPQEWTY